LSGLNTAIVLEAVQAFDLDISQIHCDTTSIPVYGNYSDGPVAGSQPENPDSAPLITYGYSKDKRPDLKQLIFGLWAYGALGTGAS
jgi:transposase